jgi:hypothetical protein
MWSKIVIASFIVALAVNEVISAAVKKSPPKNMKKFKHFGEGQAFWDPVFCQDFPDDEFFFADDLDCGEYW